MSEKLISAERLKQVLDKNFGHTGGAAVLEQLIDIAPAVDAVEVVRCKECRYDGDENECPLIAKFDNVGDYDFCSYGKRREENEID